MNKTSGSYPQRVASLAEVRGRCVTIRKSIRAVADSYKAGFLNY